MLSVYTLLRTFSSELEKTFLNQEKKNAGYNRQD